MHYNGKLSFSLKQFYGRENKRESSATKTSIFTQKMKRMILKVRHKLNKVLKKTGGYMINNKIT